MPGDGEGPVPRGGSPCGPPLAIRRVPKGLPAVGSKPDAVRCLSALLAGVDYGIGAAFGWSDRAVGQGGEVGGQEEQRGFGVGSIRVRDRR